MGVGWFQVEWRQSEAEEWRDGARPPTLEMAKDIQGRWQAMGYLVQIVRCGVSRTVL